MAKFDIIIPVYNKSSYLYKCLNSVFNQSYKDFRIIAVDDKSTDNSLEILRKYEEKFPKQMKVIESEINVGAGEARNIALRVTDAEYITFLDSDDTLKLTILEKVNNILKEYNPDIVVCGMQLIHKGVNIDFLGTKKNSINKSQLIIPQQYKRHIYDDRPNVTAKFFKRELITTEFPRIKWEDYPFIIPYLAIANSIYYLSDVGYYYTISPFNTTVSDIRNFNPKVLDIFTGTDIITETLEASLCEHYKEELRIVKTINCLQRVRDLCFVTNISKEDKILLANYLTNLINIREGNFQDLEYYQFLKRKFMFYKFRMKIIEKLINPSLQQETSEQNLKLKINYITKKYEK